MLVGWLFINICDINARRKKTSFCHFAVSAMVAYIIFRFKKTSRDMGPVQLNIYMGQKHLEHNYVI